MKLASTGSTYMYPAHSTPTCPVRWSIAHFECMLSSSSHCMMSFAASYAGSCFNPPFNEWFYLECKHGCYSWNSLQRKLTLEGVTQKTCCMWAHSHVRGWVHSTDGCMCKRSNEITQTTPFVTLAWTFIYHFPPNLPEISSRTFWYPPICLVCILYYQIIFAI